MDPSDQRQTVDGKLNSLTPAAQYIRMSTEHQQYSTANQADVIQNYAHDHGYRLVRTYADEGKSGLRVEGRTALTQLIQDVQQGEAPFTAILVYDVSRWGRFQDADESAYYEYLCKRAGIGVHYCAEQFENDGRPTSTIIKSVKRAMAGEYSRELSTKVFQGQCRLIELGYRQGGTAGYGLRRMLLDHTGKPKTILQKGEYKSLQTERVVLVPGPAEEVQTVQWIYRLFTREGKREAEIAELLNERGIQSDLGRAWTRGTVREVLTNEKYIGNNVYNRTSCKLKKKSVRNAAEMWVRKDSAFEAIVPADLFYTAQGIVLERGRRYTDEELLAGLRGLIEKHATLSSALIDAAEGLPSSSVFRRRFGSLIRAYELAGHQTERNYDYIEINRQLRGKRPQLLEHLQHQLADIGATVGLQTDSGFLMINEEYSASVVLSRCRQTSTGSLRWVLRLAPGPTPDITILARMNLTNDKPADYYLFPIMDIVAPNLLLCETNGIQLESYRFESLDFFTKLAARKRIEVAA